mmetsp:Transcript_22257/g.60063  ORF Transcript_22257/g.60063 Transcript_22257/m.60063 type:complete len:227 (+) Transcript_22257:597-1277(+)
MRPRSAADLPPAPRPPDEASPPRPPRAPVRRAERAAMARTPARILVRSLSLLTPASTRAASVRPGMACTRTAPALWRSGASRLPFMPRATSHSSTDRGAFATRPSSRGLGVRRPKLPPATGDVRAASSSRAVLAEAARCPPAPPAAPPVAATPPASSLIKSSDAPRSWKPLTLAEPASSTESSKSSSYCSSSKRRSARRAAARAESRSLPPSPPPLRPRPAAPESS